MATQQEVMNSQIITIDNELLYDLNRILDDGIRVEDEDDILYMTSTEFADGIEMDIVLRNGEPPFINATLFSNGCELHTIVFESIDLEGEYSIWYKEVEYSLIIESD